MGCPFTDLNLPIAENEYCGARWKIEDGFKKSGIGVPIPEQKSGR
jgi:hypothetical protein